MDDRADTERPDEPEESVDRLLASLGLRIDEARAFVEGTASRWRGDRIRVAEETRHRLSDMFRELGLVTRDEWEDLELRIAQIEHRLSLLERDADE